jgi:DNA-binding winged helix-turn-helix (wHTH) protein
VLIVSQNSSQPAGRILSPFVAAKNSRYNLLCRVAGVYFNEAGSSAKATEKVAKNCKTYRKGLIFEIARSLGSRQGGGRMEEHSGADIVLFGGFRFDRRRGVLSRQNEDGEIVPVPIGWRALDILGLLIDRHGDLVSRDEIMSTVWPGVVEGANVTVQISALRRTLDDGRSDGSVIQTIPGRGYRLAAAVTRCEADPLATVAGNRADRRRGYTASLPR